MTRDVHLPLQHLAQHHTTGDEPIGTSPQFPFPSAMPSFPCPAQCTPAPSPVWLLIPKQRANQGTRVFLHGEIGLGSGMWGGEQDGETGSSSAKWRAGFRSCSAAPGASPGLLLLPLSLPHPPQDKSRCQLLGDTSCLVSASPGLITERENSP